MDWPQQFKNNAPQDISSDILNNSVNVAKKIRNDDGSSTPVLTLGHLAFLTGINIRTLRSVISRRDTSPYKTFLLAKGSKDRNTIRGFRTISVPRNDLKIVQRWISDNILARQYPDHASKAYSPNSNLIEAVDPHLRCRWLIKLDLQTFFDSVSEIPIYRVFRRIGYQPLVAFELTRLCTRLGKATVWRMHSKWLRHSKKKYKISDYVSSRIGHLPQGAPSSPMLSNLVMREFDQKMTKLAAAHNFAYSRYADDLALSTRAESINRGDCQQLIHAAYKLIGEFSLAPNLSKTKISPPGSRKLLLGLLIDGARPNLTKEFRKNISLHLHFLKKFGALEHADRRGFDSVVGLRNHLYGLAYYARQINVNYGKEILSELNMFQWPI